MNLPLRDSARHTYAEYRTWTGDARYELVDGSAYLMSPAPSREHQEMVGELFFQVRAALDAGPCRVYIAPLDVRLPRAGETDEATSTVVQPDLLVVCDPDKRDALGVRGAPDWIVEVSSPATATHDRTRKLAAYESAGVPEVWLVDPATRTVSVHRLNNATAAFDAPTVLEMRGRLAVTALPGLGVDWSFVVTRLS